MTEEERPQVKELIKNKEKVFAKNDQPLTKASNIEHNIDTGDALHISSRKDQKHTRRDPF